MFLDRRKRENGFTLVEITITIGLLGFITLISMTLMKNQQGQDAILRYKYDVSMKILEVRKALSRPENCQKILAGKTVSGGAGTQIDTLTYVAGMTPIIERGFKYPTFTVTDLRLARNALPTGFDLVITAAPNSSGFVSRYFTGAGKSDVETIGVVGSLDSTGVITSCGPIVSETNLRAKEVLCRSLAPGATWNPSTSECDLNVSTFSCANASQIPTRLNRFGEVYCEWIWNVFDYNRFIDYNVYNCPTKRYSLFLRQDNGKIGVGCVPNPADRIGSPPRLN